MENTQQIKENPLGFSPIGKLLPKFAVPAIISMLVNALYNICLLYTSSSEQLIHRHICHLAFDIPQRHINAGNRIIFNRAVSPVAVLVHKLP